MQNRAGFGGRWVIVAASGAECPQQPLRQFALTQNSVVSHEITLDEEEIADVNLATFYVFDKENTGPSRHGMRLACGCWTGTYYTSGNDAYAPSPRPLGHAIAPKRVSKTPQQARPGSTTHLALRKTSR